MAGVFLRSVIFVAFVGLGIVIRLSLHLAREVEYNPLCPMIVVSLGKMACSFLLYVASDGTPRDLLGQLRGSLAVVRNYSVVAAAYCLYDVLAFVNAGLFDPQTFIVLLQFRIVMTAATWEVAFGRRNSWVRRVGLVLITVGCVTKQAGGSAYNPPRHATSWRFLLMFAQVLANSVACVTNEMLLKQKGDLSLNAQNFVQYGWIVAWCLLVGALRPIDSLGLNPFDVSNWVPMLDPRMLPNIIVLIVLGLVTAVFLKLWDAVWKAVAAVIEVFTTSFVSAALFGYAVRSLDVVAVTVTVSGIWLFAQPHSVEGWLAGKAKPA